MNLFGLADLTSNPLIVPPPLGANVGLIGGGIRADAMMAFVGLGIFMMTPKLLEMIQEALKVPAFKYGTALTEALKFGYAPISKPIGWGIGMARKAVEEPTVKAIQTEAGRFIKGRQEAGKVEEEPKSGVTL